ncbi:MAG: 4-hydroxy-3-methylbut-2-enyl diphosphate reductase [Coriobacteriales bacterium]|jgi:4-hydroxy-3-methylbut-2-enyl diphosphate reductase|nr:4-hydroxy-3-methylbut-2-enyl diphosphate reductase [Coriobacteriales bacterium]
MNILRADYAGACYGVERALKMVDKAAGAASDAGAKVYTLGPLIHNPQVVAELEGEGVHAIDDMRGVKAPATLVIRSHGVAPQVIDDASQAGFSIVDATCPHVKKAQSAAEALSSDGYYVVIIGEKGHPEVEGLRAYAAGDTCVVQKPDDLPRDIPSDKVGIVVQTTQAPEALNAIVSELQARGIQPYVVDTICFATRQRQQAAAKLAAGVDAMLVVGGRNSANTRRLYEICKGICSRTWHIEVPGEINPEWFNESDTVGVTAGASTPEAQIDAVCEYMDKLV